MRGDALASGSTSAQFPSAGGTEPQTEIRPGTKILYARYKCEKCGAQDTDKNFDHEKPPVRVNCWNCHGDATMVLKAISPTN